MCLVSDKIKFCTCVSDSVDNLQHYWIWHHFVNDIRDICIGMPIMPTSLTDLNFIINETTLLNRLNESDAFDFPIQPLNKDLFEIVINNNAPDYENRFTYTFLFKKGKWIGSDADAFTIINHYKEEKAGKIKSALKRKKK
jgi:hypothetical protein